MVKIEILYFDGRPNHEPAVERVEAVLKEEGIGATISGVNVRDAAAAREVAFQGSPSIRVNGVDVEPAAQSSRDYGMMCRTYAVNGRREGLPSREMVREAILAAQSRIAPTSESKEPAIQARKVSVFAAGSILASIVASFCCILPIVFALTGVSILGASALFDTWRPYLLGVTFALLGLGFYYEFRPRKRHCGAGSTCTMPTTNRAGRFMLWLAAAVAILFAAFPYYSGKVAELLLSPSQVPAVVPSEVPQGKRGNERKPVVPRQGRCAFGWVSRSPLGEC